MDQLKRAKGGATEADTTKRQVLLRSGQFALTDIAEADAVLSGDEWQTAFEFAQRHRVDCLFFESLDITSQDIPEDTYQRAREWSEATRRQNLSMAAELLELVEKLESEGLQVLAYKGPVVAARAYGDIGRRRFVDLDLLVPPSERADAVNVLTQQGYERWNRHKHLSETNFRDPETDVLVDLHTDVVPDDMPITLDFEGLYRRHTTVNLGGRSVPALSRHDAVITHIVHGTKHCWYRAEWALAVAAMVSQVSDTDALFETVESAGCERMFLCALELARRLFDASFDVNVEQRLDEESETTRTVSSVADETLEWVFEPDWVTDERSHLAGTRLQSRLLPTSSMKARFLLDTLTRPQQGDRELISLPASLSPLYRLVRPLRLAYIYGDALLPRTK